LPKSEFPEIAITWIPEAYAMDDVVVGRRSAGIGFLKAMIAERPRQLSCYARSLEEAEAFKRFVDSEGSPDTVVRWIPFVRPQALRQPGLLYRPDITIPSDAWRRAAEGDDRAYSICGVTHSLSPDVAMQSLASLLTAPLHNWDALVCTSRAARDSVRLVLETTAEHLKDRLGATRLPLPQLPLIPLGVDCASHDFSPSRRAESRNALGIDPDEVVVTYVGRLDFAGKAHPVPMWLALEQAAAGHRVVLLHAGQFASASVESAFREEARLFCPSVRCAFLDGRDPRTLERAWAAADVFTSLADSIQETFGLTPVEAMAAGLPSVVSDWNGYRDTIRDGIDGFRVPTLSMPPGSGGEIADRYDWGIDNYGFYMFHASQHVAVDVDAAAEAYRKLIADADLRSRMGEAARVRARSQFDWSQILAKYVALWEDLAERRRADPVFGPQGRARRRSDRADPFTMFASYPTRAVGVGTMFQQRGDDGVGQALVRLNLGSTGKAGVKAMAVLPTPALIKEILGVIPRHGWIGLEEIVRACPNRQELNVTRALVWLCKFGVVRPRPPEKD
jgi:glycosyltransferase involved in cell wall biosynthesis